MDKTEITELPEGMSSEELDRFTTGEEIEQTDETLAQEALDATATDTETESSDTPAEESAADKTAAEDDKSEQEKTTESELSETDQQLRAKDSKIASMKHENRDLAIEKARLEGQLEARESIATKAEAPEKSPLEIAEAAYIEEKGDLEGFAMNGDLYRQQRAFDKAADEKTATTDSQQQGSNTAIQAENELQEGDLSSEKMGQGLDLKTVEGIGNQYLTRGDRLDVLDMVKTHGSKPALKEAYKIMIRRTLAAGNEDSKLLQNAINIKGKIKSKSQPKPKKEPINIDALTTEGEDGITGEAEAETHSSRLANFIVGSD